jgi:hypothetical protein
MEINSFINLRKYLYHLTDARNIPNILAQQRLLSTTAIVHLAAMGNKEQFLSSRREKHCIIPIDGNEYRIRDQRPISMKALGKCLSNNWTAGQFVRHLNDRVFFWASLDRLKVHFNRYQGENPKIIRVSTESMFQVNPNPKFCRLNSGATRANSWLGGVAPSRGQETFLSFESYLNLPSSVVEVTFENSCILPTQVWISEHPNGSWEEVVLNS